MKNTKHYLAAITAFITWGFFSLVLRPIHDFPSLDILFYRVFSCAILMSVVILLFKRKVFLENRSRFLVLSTAEKRKVLSTHIAGGMLLTLNWFSFIYVMNHISVKATSLAYLVCPILTTLLAYFILKEKLLRAQWAAVILSIIGCIILSYGHLLDMGYSLIVGLSYAFYLVSQKGGAGFDKFLCLSFQIIFSAILLLPFYPFYSGPLPTEFRFYFYIEVIAVLFTIVPLLLNLFALKQISSSTVGMLMNINPLIAFSLAVFIFHEHLDLTQLLAYGLIFLAVLLFNAGFFKTRLSGIRQES